MVNAALAGAAGAAADEQVGMIAGVTEKLVAKVVRNAESAAIQVDSFHNLLKCPYQTVREYGFTEMLPSIWLNMPYGERITIDGWQLEIKPPRAARELPTIIHARYLGSH